MYQKIIENIIYPISDKLMGLSIKRDLEKNKQIQWYKTKDLNLLQGRKLYEILSHCNNNIPYYQKVFNDYNFNITGNIFQELGKIPVLTKKIIRNHLPNDLIDKRRKIYTVEKTSGSSGEQGVFYLDRQAFSKIIASQTLFWEWGRYRFGKRTLQTGINPERSLKKYLKDRLLLIKYVDAFKINEEIIKNTLKPFRKKKNIHFIGYPSSIFSYATFAKKLGINDISFESVISLGDKMFPHYRDMIENIFNTEVFDTYGAAEGLMIAGECSEHKYHILSPHVHVEILDKNGNAVPNGTLGHVVVTSLDNYLMPLIKYKIGDLAIKSNQLNNCKCGRNLPVIDKIIGRDTDILYTPKFKILVVHFFTGIFEHYPEIKQFQVEQHNMGGIIQINYIEGTNFTKVILDNIRNKIYERAEESFPLYFSNVTEIKPSPSGKPQIIVRTY